MVKTKVLRKIIAEVLSEELMNEKEKFEKDRTLRDAYAELVMFIFLSGFSFVLSVFCFLKLLYDYVVMSMMYSTANETAKSIILNDIGFSYIFWGGLICVLVVVFTFCVVMSWAAYRRYLGAYQKQT